MTSGRERTEGGGAGRTSRGGLVAILLGAIVVAIAIPIVLVTLFSDRDAPPSTWRGDEPPAARPGADPEPPLPAKARTLPKAAAAAPKTPAAPAEKASDASTASGARWVEIVDAATEVPIPDAEVFYRDSETPFEPRHFEHLIAGARSGRTDERGRIAIEWPEERTVLVLARAPGRAGGAVVPPWRSPDDVTRVALLPDWDIVVEVVDFALAPAPRVPVSRREQRSGNTMIDTASTDDAGRVVFRNTGLRVSSANPKPDLEVSVGLPLVERLSRRIDPESPPTEPIRFTLPAVGSLSVRVLDSKRSPVADGTSVDMTVVLPGESRDVSPFSRGDRIRASARTAGGTALFEHVDVGVDLEIRVTGETSEPKARDVVAGPKAPGELVEATLVLGVDHPVLVFRAVDEAGAPLPNEKLTLHSAFRSTNISNSGSAFATTDEAGVFEHELPTRFVEGDERSLRVEARGGEIGTLVDLSRFFEPGPNDMGDIPLVRAPLLVGGRVVDDAGKPAAGASVRVEVPVREATVTDRVWYWNEVPVAVVADADGRFAARAFIADKTIRATAHEGGRRSASVECALGTGDVTLVLLGVGTVLGSVRLDSGIPGDSFEARLAPRGSGGERSQADVDAERASVESSGAFRFDERLPGSYRFALRLRGMADADMSELVSFEGVEVTAGKETRDPRLQNIDLGSRLNAMRLTLVPPSDHARPLKGNATFHASGAGGEAPQWKWFQSSPVTLVTPSEAIDVTLAVTGFRTVRLENVRGDREVKLEPALEVRLVLPESVDLPRPPVHVKAALVPESVDGASPDFGGNAFDDAREIRCLAPGVGRMKVQWIVERRAGDSASANTFDVEPAQYVEVREDAGEQRFVLDVTTEALERALGRKP